MEEEHHEISTTKRTATGKNLSRGRDEGGKGCEGRDSR